MFVFEAQDIHKSFGGVIALNGVSISVKPGSVHALLGENGAGKSTLVKIMTGAVTPDSGSLRLEGAPIRFSNAAEAVESGVAVVSQELSLFPHLSVLDNLFPMREPKIGPFINTKLMKTLATPVLEELGFTAPTSTLVGDLTLAQRQLVEIAKALITQPKVLLLDEPTSALEGQATERLLNILRVLKQRQVAVIFVTHILEEVMNVCDEVTVLRDGKTVIEGESVENHTIASIVQAMIGDRVIPPRVTKSTRARVEGSTRSLTVENLSLDSGVSGVSFVAHSGEVVGLAGLVGSGPTEVLRAIAGTERISGGTITLPTGQSAPRTQRKAIESGVAFVSGDRKRYGLMLDKPVWENIVQVKAMGLALDGQYLRINQLIARASELITRLRIKVASPLLPANSMSGGNQQKVVLAKWLDVSPNTLLLDDPTRGVDIGARAEIHGLLSEYSETGAVVLMCSTDLQELSSACDRVLVFYRGSICGELQGESLISSNILQLMNTGSDSSAGVRG
jgi:ABC-type sugar transport system ATPase subunit